MERGQMNNVVGSIDTIGYLIEYHFRFPVQYEYSVSFPEKSRRLPFPASNDSQPW